jgi:Zn-dependent protease with chaperone function
VHFHHLAALADVGRTLAQKEAMKFQLSTHRYARIAVAMATTVALAAPSWAQTHIVAPNNKYSPNDDVKLGQDAAAQVRREMPLLRDERIDGWVDQVGQRLATAIPAEYRHSEFRYTFEVVNQKEINAFALPGGPMFLNRGMIEAAKSEGEVAGVMAHEMSHVALRHGTAQATKGEKFQIGAIAGQVLGAIVGGTAGSVISQGSQLGLGTYFLKYSREYESQADVLGAQIMARAGYDPREMANMFKTIEAQGGGGGPEFLSDHPNPGNRYARITDEARSLQVNARADTGEFPNVQSRLKGMGKAYTAEEIARGQARTGRNTPVGTAGRAVVRVDPPSSRMRTYRPADFFRVGIPENWRQASSDGGVTYAPDGAVFQGQGGGSAFTHGVEFGVAQGGNGNLQRDSQALLQTFARGNPDLRQQSGWRSADVGGRRGLVTQLSNVSEVTGQQEYIALTTTYLRNGNMLYMIGVAPREEAGTYDRAFQRVRDSIELQDR